MMACKGLIRRTFFDSVVASRHLLYCRYSHQLSHLSLSDIYVAFTLSLVRIQIQMRQRHQTIGALPVLAAACQPRSDSKSRTQFAMESIRCSNHGTSP